MRAGHGLRRVAPASFALLLVLVARSSAAAEPVNARLVLDRESRAYREVVVERHGTVVQQLALPDIVLEGPQQVRLTDFDGDGRRDLVVLPSGTRGHLANWLVFRFDAATGRFHRRPWYFYSRGSRALRSPAPGFRVEQLAAGEGCAGCDAIPSGHEGLLVIHRRGEITQTLDDRSSQLSERADVATSSDVDGDGHVDLVTYTGGADNSWNNVWRFDPTTNRFVFVSTLAGLTLDARKKQVTTFLNRGLAGATHVETRYRFVNGKLEKLWEADQDSAFGMPQPRGAPADATFFTLRIRERVADKMTLICEALVDVTRSWRKAPHILRGDAAACRQ